MPLKNVAGIIRGRELLEVLDTFFCFRGAGIIRGGTLLEVLRYLKSIKIGQEVIIIRKSTKIEGDRFKHFDWFKYFISNKRKAGYTNF